jgi:hypothetical protein
MPGPFELQLRRFAEKAGARADAAVRGVVLEFGARLIARSPVDTGRFRSNWFYGLNEADRTATQDTGQKAVQGLARMPVQAGGQVHYLTNNLPYAWKLETGWSKQAPLGMVGITVVEFQGIVDDAATRAAAMERNLAVLGSPE